jgi:hypothetical protein
MPVVINEFEVVSDPPPAEAPPGAQPRTAGDALPPWAVHDIEEIVRRAAERAARVRAD